MKPTVEKTIEEIDQIAEAISKIEYINDKEEIATAEPDKITYAIREHLWKSIQQARKLFREELVEIAEDLKIEHCMKKPNGAIMFDEFGRYEIKPEQQRAWKKAFKQESEKLKQERKFTLKGHIATDCPRLATIGEDVKQALAGLIFEPVSAAETVAEPA